MGSSNFFIGFRPEPQEQAKAWPGALSLKWKEETSVFTNETEISFEAFYKRWIVVGIFSNWILL